MPSAVRLVPNHASIDANHLSEFFLSVCVRTDLWVVSYPAGLDTE